MVYYFLHFLLQYFTSPHTFSHFLRHVNGLPHEKQIFSGRFSFFTPFMVLHTVIEPLSKLCDNNLILYSLYLKPHVDQ